MLSPVRTVPPPEPAGPDGPDRDGHTPPVDGRRRAVLVLGLIAALAAMVFPFAPVQQPEVRYSWTASDGPAAIPLMPYQPVELTATTSCATARSAGTGRVLLSTVPLRPDPAAAPLYGLRLTVTGGGLQVASAGVELGTAVLPDGACAVSVVSDAQRTAVLVDGEPVLSREADVRPDVAGAFADVTSGVELALTTDTRFQTTISPLKAAIGVVCLLALAGMLVALRRADRAVTAPVRLLPRGLWRPRPVDAAVTALLGVWWLVGANTVDDGYIAGIVRSRGSNGFVGNVYRWLNAPEAPFSWFYDLYYAWSLISPSTPWMRLPSTLLGLLCWGLLSRLVLPRLGPFATGRSVPWVAALAFGAWWIPFNLGLRPEPWVAVGGLGVFLAVERAIATRRVLPLAGALVLAGATTALTPGGLLAFTPFLAAMLPVLRLLRARRDLHLLPLVVALVAASASAVLLMTADQSLAGLLESTRVRRVIGGGLSWYEEFARYATLLTPDLFLGAIGRRAAVLCTLLAAVGVLWMLRRGSTAGIAGGPARRLVTGLLLALASMTASPTKWTQHFGGVAGYGAAVLVLAAVVWSAAPLRDRPRSFVGGLAAATVVAAVVLAGYNLWPYTGAWFDPAFSTSLPSAFGVALTKVTIVAGMVLVVGLAVRSAWLRAGGAAAVPVPSWVPAPAPLLGVVLVVVLAVQVLGFATVAVEVRDSYTPAADAIATLAGEPCGLQRLLSVETDPAAGLLPVVIGSSMGRTRPVDVGGRTLPGIAVAGRTSTPWFALDPAQRRADLPVVITTSGGGIRPGDALYLEFATGGSVVARYPVTPTQDEPRDARVIAPQGADTVRLTIDAPTSGPRSPAMVSLPRVPQLTPMTELLPERSTAILDWPVAFLFPCLTPQPLPLGTAGLARWRVAPTATDPSAGITYAPAFGGPFAAPRLLVTEQRMPTYLQGDPLRDAGQLYRWVPITPLITPEPVVAVRSVTGWSVEGHARVPGLDPVG